MFKWQEDHDMTLLISTRHIMVNKITALKATSPSHQLLAFVLTLVLSMCIVKSKKSPGIFGCWLYVSRIEN